MKPRDAIGWLAGAQIEKLIEIGPRLRGQSDAAWYGNVLEADRVTLRDHVAARDARQEKLNGYQQMNTSN